MYEIKKNLERYGRIKPFGPSPRLMKKEFTGPRSHKSWETLVYTKNVLAITHFLPTHGTVSL